MMNMKAQRIVDEQLSHKKRTVADLIRYIRTRDSNETCNYALLLGSGASVTSEIRSGNELVKEWTLELYERYSGKVTSDIGEAENYLVEQQSNWYNPLSKYSSLFERKFDLASQRRRFVETEVDGKLPSIGYAYLTDLCEKNYFNTIFTTNFDDLINEAFYQFSNIRPVHCAHDSSVNSISMTSKRPKILKLHGDYLFDDIKSTLRETESLEQNTKDKFSESCKEYGLVVIGYSGNDRSVMDVLEFLSKQENYLLNGIYWCLRPDDNVNQALKNLLWKDKVYPVIIDGFDQFMARLHASVQGGSLTLAPNSKESKLRKSISKIVEDKFDLSSNADIKREIEYLKDESDKNDVSLLLSDLTFGEDSGQVLRQSTLKELVEIDSLIKKGSYHEAYDVAERSLNKSNEKDGIRFIHRLISISEKKKDSHLKNKWIRRLLDIDRNNVNYIVRNARMKLDLDDQINFLVKAKNDSLPRPELSREIASVYATKSNATCLKEEKVKNLELALEYLEESLKVDSSIDNTALSSKISICKKLYRITNDDKWIPRIESALKRFDSFDGKDRLGLMLNLDVSESKESKLSSIPAKRPQEILDDIYSVYSLSSIAEREWIHGNLIAYASKNYFSNSDVVKCRSVFSSNIVSEHERTALSLFFMAEYYLYLNADVEKSRDTLRKIKDVEDMSDIFKKILDISGIVGGNVFEEFKSLYESERNNLDPDDIFDCDLEILTYEKDYEAAVDLILQRSEELEEKEFMLETRTFLLLKMEKYREVVRLGYKFEDFMYSDDGEVVYVNFSFAKKKLGEDLSSKEKTRQTNLIASSKNFGVRGCLSAMKNQEQQAKSNLSEMMKENLKNIYVLKDWPILEDKTLIEGSLKMLEKSGLKYCSETAIS